MSVIPFFLAGRILLSPDATKAKPLAHVPTCPVVGVHNCDDGARPEMLKGGIYQQLGRFATKTKAPVLARYKHLKLRFLRRETWLRQRCTACKVARGFYRNTK